MRIKSNTSPRDIEQNKSSNLSVKTGSSPVFTQELHKMQSEHSSYDQETDELRREIEAAGDKLDKEPNLANFKYFRDLLSRMTKRVSNEAFRLEKIGGTPQNPRYFEIITVINAEADRLYNLLIHDQRDRLAITAKVIGIKGLVVDLVT